MLLKKGGNSAQRAGRNTHGYRRFATAPTYELQPHWSNGFVLLFHIFLSLLGIFVGFRLHRRTYVRATVLVHEADFTRFPYEQSRAAEKEPFSFGRADVRFSSPPDRIGMSNFLYIAHHEQMSLRRWMLLLIYCGLLSIPFWEMRHGWPFSSQLSFHGAILYMLSPMRIVGWCVHTLLALYYTNAYFANLDYTHAFLLPVYALLAPILVLYSKIGWTGIDGPLPKLSIAHLVPSSTSRFTDVYQDEEDEDDDDNHEQQPSPPPPPPPKEDVKPKDAPSPEASEKEADKLARLERLVEALIADKEKK